MNADVAPPDALLIWRHHYPLQSAEASFAYSGEIASIAAALRAQLPIQHNLADSVARMSGEFIESAEVVVSHRAPTR